jgi:NDP-sugar pyrophosphorylase family protein
MDAAATMAVKRYSFQVPYGVAVSNEHHYITSIEEKPVHDFFVNAGIYVLSSTAVCKIPKDSYYDMPSLFHELLAECKPIAAFPIHEYWLDIGRPTDYEKANREFSDIFKVDD